MEKRAVEKFIWIAPRKVKIVMDLIRGKKVEEALNQLHFLTKRAARPVEKAIRSAVANLVNEKGSTNVDTDTLFIKKIWVNKGPIVKRYSPRAMGRVNIIRKRMSHITVVVSDEEES